MGIVLGCIDLVTYEVKEISCFKFLTPHRNHKK